VTLRQADATGWQQETLDNHAMAGIRREWKTGRDSTWNATA
jgi:hypothetical protein